VLPAVQPIEIRDPVHAKQYGFAIEDELVGSDATRRFNNQRIAARPVVAVAGEKPNAVIVALNDQAEAILLDLVNPVSMMRYFCPAGRYARLERCFGHATHIGFIQPNANP